MIRQEKVLFTVLLALVLAWMPMDSCAADQSSIVPMTIEYSLLNTLVAQAFFSGAGRQTTLLHEQDGCQELIVSSPRFFEESSELFLEIRLRLRQGLGVGGVCLLPLSFDGFLVMRKTPVLGPKDWTLRFATESSTLLNQDRKPARLASLAWGMIEDHVFPHQETIRLDLGPPILELQDFLPLIMPRDQPDLVLEMLASLHPEKVIVGPSGLRLENTILVPSGFYHDEAPEAPLTREELELFIAAWETWDSFMVTMIATLAAKDLNADERLLLLDVLLRLRHGFVLELDDPAPDRDIVRTQFVEAWEVLGPMFRNHLIIAESGSLLGYLAFFSASDALVALDKLGPALGLDISLDGLLRLARLLADGRESALVYGPEVLPDLLRALGIEDHSTLDDALPAPLSWPWLVTLLGRIFAAPAWAESPPADLGPGRGDPWIFRPADIHGYMERVASLLREQGGKTLQGSAMADQHREMFVDMVLATAWQESCFRQFVAKGEQVTFLRSYNNTSVGIMQINERVWRGIYDQHKLRWDIAYNARAGTKVLELYLTRYAEPRMGREPEQEWTANRVAGMLYAMYNGGPAQLRPFLERQAQGGLYRSDRLFREKWDWVRQDALDKVSICLIGT